MKTNTSWVADIKEREYPSLVTDMEVDVAIIGAGITGVLTAYMLAKEGKKVAIIEKERIGEGVTHLTTAFLTQIIDTDLRDLISIYGEEKAKRIVDSHMEAINLIEKIAKDEEIDSYFMRCSDYMYINDEKQFSDLREEYVAVNKLGIDARISEKRMLGFKNYGYIEVKNQAKFHPMRFVTELMEKASELGVGIFEQTEAAEIIESPSLSIKTKNGNTLKAKWIIGATYNPFRQPLGLFFKKGNYTSYILEADIPKNVLQEGIYEDTENPYHYFRVDKMDGPNDGLLIGGEDHRSDVYVNEDKCYAALENYLKETFTDMEYKINKRWKGPILEPTDGLALIGPHKNPNILYAFGFSGNGMTYAGVSALIFKDLVNGKPSELHEIYKASRVLDPKSLLYKARDYGSELVHGAIKNTFSQKVS